MLRFVEFLERHARGRTLLATFLASAVFMGVLFAHAVPRIRSHSPEAVPLDVTNGYTPDEAYRMISLYGDDVRSFYVVNAFTADVLAPFFANLFFVLASLRLLRRSAGEGSRWRVPVVLLGGLAFFADLAENILLSIAVSRFPARADGIVVAASYATATKRVAVFATWGVLLVLGVAAGVSVSRGRRSGEPPRNPPGDSTARAPRT